MKDGAYIKLAFAILASGYAWYYVATATGPHLIDGVDLFIHEAGHVIFTPFGEFLQVLMGSVFQILFPLVFAMYFLRQQSYFSASIILFWVGINIVNASLYVGDAQRMQLELIGGEHDWHWILSTLGILSYTDEIGRTVYIVGLAVIVLATYLSVRYAYEDAH